MFLLILFKPRKHKNRENGGHLKKETKTAKTMDKKDTMKENKRFYFAYQISTQPQYSYSQQAIDFIYDEIKKASDTILDDLKEKLQKNSHPQE